MAHKTRLLRHKIRRAIVAVEMAVGEIAAAAARNADFFADFGRMVKQRHTLPFLAYAGGAHHAGRPGADYHGIEKSCHQAARAIEKPYCSARPSDTNPKK